MFSILLRKTFGMTKFRLKPTAVQFSSYANLSFAEQIRLLRGEKSEFCGTLDEIKEKIRINLTIQSGWSPKPINREHLLQYSPTADELPKRTMRDSYSSAVLPLKTDLKAQEKYVSQVGNARMGRLMEDLDLFAVWVCHRHVLLPNLPKGKGLPYTFVTILVDQIIMDDVTRHGNEDIVFNGHIAAVGRSSMMINAWLEQTHNKVTEILVTARLLFVARNATNTGPAVVNPLRQPVDDKEKAIAASVTTRNFQREFKNIAYINDIVPDVEEQSLIYEVFNRTTDSQSMKLNKRILPDNAHWMTDIIASNTFVAYPENRNSQNTLFGGFLMRTAIEISYISSTLFCKQPLPKARYLCDVVFKKPVHMASFVRMTSYVVYTEDNYMVCIVVADILSQDNVSEITSNYFYAIYSAQNEVPEVLPFSYHETLWYIQGRRIFNDAICSNI